MLNESLRDQNVPDYYEYYDLNNNNNNIYTTSNEHDDCLYYSSSQTTDSTISPYKTVKTTTTTTTGSTRTRSCNDEFINSRIQENKIRKEKQPDEQQPQQQIKPTMKRGYCDDNENISSSSSSSLLSSTQRVTKRPKSSIVTYKEMTEFFHLLNDETIQDFLERDQCCMVSDKYALAMVFTYFKRARLTCKEFTRTNFFLALYLANDIEEDCDDYKYEIFPWALGSSWRSKFQSFLKKRDSLLQNMGYRAMVSRKCCDEVMSLVPDHYAWKRSRPADHGGATRAYIIRKIDSENGENDFYIEDGVLIPRGPLKSPRPCPLCVIRIKQREQEQEEEEEQDNDDEDYEGESQEKK